MKAGWEVKPLGEVCEILSGSGFPTKHQGSASGEYAFVKVSDMNLQGNEVFFNFSNNYIDESTRKELGAKIFSIGSILFPKVGGAIITNKKRRVVSPLCADNNLMGLLGDRDKLDADYLFHWMQSQDIYEFSNKSNPPSITQATVKAWPIPIPPLEEQKQIVAVLDAAFEGLTRAKENAEANLQNARELLAGFTRDKMNGANTPSKKVKLSDVCSIVSKLVDPKLDEHQDLKHLGAGNMITESDFLIDVKTAREEELISGKHPFSKEDVLYSKIRPYLKKVARPSFAGLCSADVYPLTPKEGLNRDFLFHLLLGPEFTDYAIAGSSRAGMPKVNRKHLFDYEFNLPTTEDQVKIAGAIDRLRMETADLELNYTTKLTDIAQLRQSLLQKAFAGELT